MVGFAVTLSLFLQFLLKNAAGAPSAYICVHTQIG